MITPKFKIGDRFFLRHNKLECTIIEIKLHPVELITSTYGVMTPNGFLSLPEGYIIGNIASDEEVFQWKMEM